LTQGFYVRRGAG